MTSETIFALSSGMPPAAIAVLRISGPAAGTALAALAGSLPAPRKAVLRALRHPVSGETLDRTLILWFPGPNSATGEDLAEIHAHGGRAVVRAIERALAGLPGVRSAQPGEFTRRAFEHGQIDLAEAEGLADLLTAETENQRRQAQAMAGGLLSRQVEQWQVQLLTLSAQAEAALDFSDEDDGAGNDQQAAALAQAMAATAAGLDALLAAPRSERLLDGIRVAIGGPPNAGKSTLLNALAQRDAAIVSATAGTTRDIVEVPLAIEGIAYRFADTAGLRDDTDDAIEGEGIARAKSWIDQADILLWLGDPLAAPDHPRIIRIAAQSDRQDAADAAWLARMQQTDISLSAVTGEGLDALLYRLRQLTRDLLPAEGEVALNTRQAQLLAEVRDALAGDEHDPLLLAERLRSARHALDRVTGRAGTEAMLDSLFGRFCIGK